MTSAASRKDAEMAHPNAELVQAAYSAFLRGDLDALPEYFDPDIVWHIPGRGELAGDLEGLPRVIEALASLPELTGGTLKLTVHDVLASDDHVVALISEHAERNGRILDDNFVQVVHVRNGKVTEVWNVYTDLYAHDELFA
jgi:uncharacterized protein